MSKKKRNSVYDMPPPLHSRVKVKKRPAAWSLEICHTAKQFETISQWIETYVEHFEGKTVLEIVDIARHGLRHDKKEEGERVPRFKVHPCTVRKLNANSIIESAKLAKIKFGVLNG